MVTKIWKFSHKIQYNLVHIKNKSPIFAPNQGGF